MKFSVFSQARTELGDKCEIKFSIGGKALQISIRGVDARPEYVTVMPSQLEKLHELLGRAIRSNNEHESKSENGRLVNVEAGEIPRS